MQQKRDRTTDLSIQRLPLIIRTAANVKALRVNSRAVRRLPAEGIVVAIDNLDSITAQILKLRIGAYIRACGCAEGGVCGLLVLLGFLVDVWMQISSYGAQWRELGTIAFGLLMAALSGGLCKFIGLALAQIRFERYCDKVIRLINNNSHQTRKNHDLSSMGGSGPHRM